MAPKPPAAADAETAITVHAPCRADLAGGTVDLWPLYLFHPGALTLNFALEILTTCTITPLEGTRIVLRSLDTGRQDNFADLAELNAQRKPQHVLAACAVSFFAPERGFCLETNSASPAGAGISGSSAMMIATCAALARFTGRDFDLEKLRILAQNIEAQIIRVPTGCQDYYPALYGGVSAIHLNTDGIHRAPVPVAPEDIEMRFLLAYTGAPRQSGINNWEVFKSHIDGDRHVYHNFEKIVAIARDMHQAFLRHDWEDVARLLREEWKLRRTNAPGITTPKIDKLIEAARKKGGRAAKVCGAGGGGCVLLMVEEDAKETVSEAVANAGGQMLPLQVAREGLRISQH